VSPLMPAFPPQVFIHSFIHFIVIVIVIIITTPSAEGQPLFVSYYYNVSVDTKIGLF
jgi:hypothetical protein